MHCWTRQNRSQTGQLRERMGIVTSFQNPECSCNLNHKRLYSIAALPAPPKVVGFSPFRLRVVSACCAWCCVWSWFHRFAAGGGLCAFCIWFYRFFLRTEHISSLWIDKALVRFRKKIIWNTSKTKEVGLVHMDRWSIISSCFKLEFRTAPIFLNKTIVKQVKKRSTAKEWVLWLVFWVPGWNLNHIKVQDCELNLIKVNWASLGQPIRGEPNTGLQLKKTGLYNKVLLPGPDFVLGRHFTLVLDWKPGLETGIFRMKRCLVI